MAATSIGSYIQTVQEFLAHWEQVNEAITPTPFTLPDGTEYDNLQNLSVDLQELIDQVTVAENTVEMQTSLLLAQKEKMNAYMPLFRQTIQVRFKGKPYPTMLARTPQISIGQTPFTKAYVDNANVWKLVNTLGNTVPGFTPPLILTGGIPKATMDNDITTIRTLYLEYEQAVSSANEVRIYRDNKIIPIRQILVTYREALPVALGLNAPLVQTMPRLTPLPGTTPKAVNASGRWDVPAQKAVISWTESEQTNLYEYSLRVCTGKTYRTKDESVVAAIPKEFLSYATDAGLVTPKATALYKVYVVTTTGNEKGSLAISITRP